VDASNEIIFRDNSVENSLLVHLSLERLFEDIRVIDDARLFQATGSQRESSHIEIACESYDWG
jgi:hypothetical protein